MVQLIIDNCSENKDNDNTHKAKSRTRSLFKQNRKIEIEKNRKTENRKIQFYYSVSDIWRFLRQRLMKVDCVILIVEWIFSRTDLIYRNMA